MRFRAFPLQRGEKVDGERDERGKGGERSYLGLVDL